MSHVPCPESRVPCPMSHVPRALSRPVGGHPIGNNLTVAKTYSSISDDHRAFIEKQPLFFVASAPLSGGGHVNLSPKGLDALRVLDPNTVMYLDLTGSGNETAAHLIENG